LKKANAPAGPAVPKTRSSRTNPSEQLLVEMVTELAAVLLSAGIGVPEFEDAAKRGFVSAASRIARLGNERLNKSAVAAMTGLSRTEVKRLAEPQIKESSRSRSRQRALRVLDGWQADADFIDSTGSPRDLALKSDAAEFGALVRRYSGDIPPKAILRELIRLDLVTASDTHVRLRKLDPDRRALRNLETAAATITPILARLSGNSNSSGRLVARDLTLTVPDFKAHRLLHRQVNDAIRSFFLNLQNAADGGSLPRKKSSKGGKKTRISVLVSD
jgi:hypothetical protein